MVSLYMSWVYHVTWLADLQTRNLTINSSYNRRFRSYIVPEKRKRQLEVGEIDTDNATVESRYVVPTSFR